MTLWEIVLVILIGLFFAGLLGLCVSGILLLAIEEMRKAGMSEEEIEQALAENSARQTQIHRNFP